MATNRFLSGRIYSNRFFSGPDLFGSVSFGSGSFDKRNLDPKDTCKFLVRFWVKYSLVGSGSGFWVQVKMPKPNIYLYFHTKKK